MMETKIGVLLKSTVTANFWSIFNFPGRHCLQWKSSNKFNNWYLLNPCTVVVQCLPLDISIVKLIELVAHCLPNGLKNRPKLGRFI